MTSNTKEWYNRISPFWIINITGWSALYIIQVLLYHYNQLSDIKVTLGLFLTKLTGFFISIFLRFIYRRLKYSSQSILKLATYGILISLLMSHVWFIVDFLVSIPLQGFDYLFDNYYVLNNYLKTIWAGFYTLILWSTLYFVIKFWLEWKTQKEQTEKAILLAQSAQLQMLRYQVNPHFLFNSLSSLRALVRENQKKAEDMILQISKFLRYSLMSKKNNQVLLKEEIEALGHYFDIERVRFGDKLVTNIDVTPEANELMIPSFLVHPIIENAIKYGMDTSNMPLIINLSAKVNGNTLQIDVINSGHWIKKNNTFKNDGTGTGIKNVKQRLDLAFPNNNSFEIFKNDNDVHVRIKITY